LTKKNAKRYFRKLRKQRKDNSGEVQGDSQSEKAKMMFQIKKREGSKRCSQKKKQKAERIAINNANVDDFKNALKKASIISLVKDKVDDIDGLNSNGIDIIDVIANIVKKQAMAAGIKMDEAISKLSNILKNRTLTLIDVML
jgi:hypothetical protein